VGRSAIDNLEAVMIESDEETHDVKLEAIVQLHPMRNKHNFAARGAVLALALTAAVALNTTAIAQAPPGSLWYNGDFNGVGYHANGHNTSDPPDVVHDDFNVPFPAWNITAIFSDDLLSAVVTGAIWQIRVGCSIGNPGTLIASGFTATPTVTPTGRSGFGYSEYMVEVTGLNVTLTPGTYWLSVTPLGDGTGHSFNTTTGGANCVGTPCGNDGMSWFDSVGPFNPNDFSMGVIGSVVPEPETWALLGAGLGALLFIARWRRSHFNRKKHAHYSHER